MITKENIGAYTFQEYEKIGTTKISNEVVLAGEIVETYEGIFVCAENSRLALDAHGNIYPIAESIFRKAYREPTLLREIDGIIYKRHEEIE